MIHKINLRYATKMAMLVFFVLAVVLLFVPVDTFFHEGSHWVFHKVSPFTEPTSFHVLDENSFRRGVAGYVETAWSYYGASKDQPKFFGLLNECLATFVGFMAHLICSGIVCWYLLVVRDVLGLDELWRVYAKTSC